MYFAAPARSLSSGGLHGPVYCQEDGTARGAPSPVPGPARTPSRERPRELHGPVYCQEPGTASAPAPARTPSKERPKELHGPVYCQEDRSRTGMTFQQEERRREELRREEEARQEEARRKDAERMEGERQRAEAGKQQEEERRRMEEERRLAEEKMRRQEEERRGQEEERMRRQEEERRRQEEQLRREKEEQRLRQLELKKAEEERKKEELTRLRQEEEAKRQEEIRLEQELRRQFQLQQQQDQEELRRRQQEQEDIRRKQEQEQEEQRRRQEQRQREEAEQRSAEARQAQQSVGRATTPRLVRTKSFDRPQPLPLPASEGQEGQKEEDQKHLRSARTGQVMEKRNMWAMRSASMERLPQTSPAPRRRRIDWGRKEAEEEEGSRPGSSLGQAAHTGAVRSLSTGFLSKSKSSSAVHAQEERCKPRARLAAGWQREQEEAQKEAFLKAQEVKTNKVTSTVTGWGKGQGAGSGRSTPVVSRNIGESHTENRVAKVAADDKTANSWRSGQPEPSVKLMNVTVEKAAGSTQNIQISENAHSQMANFFATEKKEEKREETVMKTRTNTMSSVSSSKSMMSTGSSGSRSEVGAPPAPARSTSHGGKQDMSSLPPNSPGDCGASPPTGDQDHESGHLDSVHAQMAQPATEKAEARESIKVDSLKSESAKVATLKSESEKSFTAQNEIAKVVSMKSESANIAETRFETSKATSKSEIVKVTGQQNESATISLLSSEICESSKVASMKTQSVASSTSKSESVNVANSKSDSSKVVSMNSDKTLNSKHEIVPRPEDHVVADGVQPSPSSQSITSLLSCCSSSALPLPVRAGWYDDPSASTPPLDPSTPSETPLPVLASWYSPADRIEQANKKIDKANQKIEQAVSNIDEAARKIEQMTVKSVTEPLDYNKNITEPVNKSSTKTIANASTSKTLAQSSSTYTANTKSINQKVETKSNIEDTTREDKAALEQSKKYSDTVIESVINDKDTCGDDTKKKLNDMFDELVNEQNTLEILESSEQSGTVKRCQDEKIQKLTLDDTDNRSVKSDNTVIETSSMKSINETQTMPKDSPDSSVLSVPQSPSMVRKMFQQGNSFLQQSNSSSSSFVRTTETELSGDNFRRGKVRQSRDTFLRQAEADLEVKPELAEPRLEVPPSPREARKKFQMCDAGEEESARNLELKQAKLDELAAVRASRVAVEQESFLAQQVKSAGAREREERAQELVLLSSRRQEVQEAGVEDKELQLRQERNRELAALAGRSAETGPLEEPAGRERLAREERAQELAAVAGRTVERPDWNSGEQRAQQLKEERRRELEELAQRKLDIPVQEGETREQELRAERARELADLARRPTASPQLVAASEQLDEVTEELRQIAEMERNFPEPRVLTPEVSEAEMRSRVRNTAASWREREAEAGQERGGETSAPGTPAPSRRIGSLFRRDPDYWKLTDQEEELPPPAGELLEPPPPPRQVRDDTQTYWTWHFIAVGWTLLISRYH